MTNSPLFADISRNTRCGLIPEQILAAIDDPAIEVVSFDVFDTLLVRPVLEPTDLFFLVEGSWRTVGGPGNFPHWRIAAERRARQTMRVRNPAVEEPTLEAIYETLGALSGLSASALDVVREAELAVERRWLSARSCLVPSFQYAIESGKRVVAISDCYLPPTFLAARLADAGFAGIESIFVSCESGRTKAAGRLYALASDFLGVPTHHIVHIGDNANSDVRQARLAGLKAVWLPSAVVASFSDRAFARIWGGGRPLTAASRLLLGLALNEGFDRISPTDVTPALRGDPDAFGRSIAGPALLAAAREDGRQTAVGRWATAMVDELGAPADVLDGARAFAGVANELLAPLQPDIDDLLSVASPLLARASAPGTEAHGRLLASLPSLEPALAHQLPPTLWQRLRLALLQTRGGRHYVRALTGHRPL